MSCSSWVCTLGYSSVTLTMENPSQNQVFWGRESARKRRRERERDCLGCPGWVRSSSVVLKGKTVFDLASVHFHLPWHVKPIWEQKDKFYMTHFKHLALGKSLTVSEREISFPVSTPESFISTQKEMKQWKLVCPNDKHKARMKS